MVCVQSDVNRRRAMRQKKARLRRLKVLLVFLLIVALITTAIMCFTLFFPIKRINVSGSKIYSKSEIIKASQLTTDDQLLSVSEKKVEDNIRQNLPYVKSVKLKRALPDAVILTVTDAEEYAFYQSENSYFILGDNGYILKEQSEIPENVFQIVTTGIEGKVSQKAKYKNSAEEQLVNTLITSLKKEKINVDEINVSNILQITLRVDGRFTVVLGTTDYLTEKIAHLEGMIASIPDRKGKINLSMWTPTNSQGSFVEQSN